MVRGVTRTRGWPVSLSALLPQPAGVAARRPRGHPVDEGADRQPLPVSDDARQAEAGQPPARRVSRPACPPCPAAREHPLTPTLAPAGRRSRRSRRSCAVLGPCPPCRWPAPTATRCHAGCARTFPWGTRWPSGRSASGSCCSASSAPTWPSRPTRCACVTPWTPRTPRTPRLPRALPSRPLAECPSSPWWALVGVLAGEGLPPERATLL